MECNMARPRPFNHSSESREQAPVLTPEESRQGVISGRVATILTVSLLLALVAFVIVYATEIL